MLLPLRDENPTRTFPLVVALLLAANGAVFLYQSLMPETYERLFVNVYGAVPALLLGKLGFSDIVPSSTIAYARYHDLPAAPLQPIWLSLFTSMFLHGDLFHIGGNMLYLWIFGNNVEDALGHFRFLIFYFLCGAIAAGLQIAMSASSPIPMIGASGAIAGVLGAYYVKFPQARIRTLVFMVIFITVVSLPASLVLALWFLLQVLHSTSAIGTESAGGGVAVFAHIGGFLAGWALVRRFEPRRRRPRPFTWA